MPAAGATVIAGRYRLGHRLGQGGMGVVWAAVDELLGRRVALKQVHSPVADKRAFREARAAARLASPYIVTVHDLVFDQGRPWIVMELVPGRSLASALVDGPLSETEVLGIAVHVLKALVAAHHGGVLHRDVKPANILLAGDRAVLTDFGIAAVDGRPALTGGTDLAGSLEYLAPERVTGGRATPEADLWSLGMTLYQAVEGKSPFAGTGLPAALAAATSREPDPPERADVLRPLIKRLLSKKPAERGTARKALELVEGGATPGRPRKRFAVLCAALVVAASVAGFLARPDDPMPARPGGFVTQVLDAFEVDVPQGWQQQVAGQTVTWNDPRPGVVRWFRIGPVESEIANPIGYQRDEDARLAAQPNYQRLRLAEVPAAAGRRSAADLEYRRAFQPGMQPIRVYSRVLVSRWGRLYEIRFMSHAPQDWQESERIRDVVLDSFRLR